MPGAASQSGSKLRRLKPQRVVGRGAIGGRYGPVVEPKIDTELGAMMHEMVKEHLAVGQKTRAAKDRLALDDQLPVVLPRAVRGFLQRFADLRRTVVEDGDELLRRFKRQRLVAFG